MSKAAASCVTDQHLLFFGTIVQCFARYEFLMQEIMAAVSGADATSVKLLTATLSFNEKRDALFRLLSHRAVPFDQIEQIRSYLRIPSAFTSLRDDIAHSIWTEGVPQGSIWPAWLSHGSLTAVKPLHDIGSQAKAFVEGDADKVTYTLDDLREISHRLTLNHSGLEAYAVAIGLARSQ
jgi:hypothetical protein